jgi:spermidine/putrescine transport system substrate-binding protein
MKRWNFVSPPLLGAIVLLGCLFFSAAGCSRTSENEVLPGAEQRVLHLFNWNNYIAPKTVAKFEKFCDCNLSQDYYSDNEEMLAKLAAGASGYDLIVPTGHAMDALIRNGALMPLDKSRIPDLVNINPAFLDTAFDPGNLYSVPYAYTLTLLGFNKEKINELGLPTDTWAIIFEPEYLKKIKGRVTVLDSQRELMAAALSYLGYSINDTDEAHWREAAELIVRAKPYWAAFSNTTYIKELATGNVWVAHGYSNDMFQAARDAKKTGRGFTIGYSVPKQGAVLALDSMVLHRSGGRSDLAHQFINFMLEGKNSAELTNLTGSGNPNVEAMQYIQAEITENEALFPPPERLVQLAMLRDLDRKQRRLLSRLWTQIKLR